VPKIKVRQITSRASLLDIIFPSKRKNSVIKKEIKLHADLKIAGDKS
jgi:hypothetical protein